jgi:hypothetical protein
MAMAISLGNGSIWLSPAKKFLFPSLRYRSCCSLPRPQGRDQHHGLLCKWNLPVLLFAPDSDTPAKLGFPRRSAARLTARPEGAASSPRANGLESKKPQSTRACAAFETGWNQQNWTSFFLSQQSSMSSVCHNSTQPRGQCCLIIWPRNSNAMLQNCNTCITHHCLSRVRFFFCSPFALTLASRILPVHQMPLECAAF